MGDPDETEHCGRCAASTVVEVATEDGDPARDPFAGDRIEVDERELRIAAAPAVLLDRVQRRLDAIAARIVFGER